MKKQQKKPLNLEKLKITKLHQLHPIKGGGCSNGMTAHNGCDKSFGCKPKEG